MPEYANVKIDLFNDIISHGTYLMFYCDGSLQSSLYIIVVYSLI